MINFLFIILSFFSFSNNSQRIGKSGSDYLINNINKPYTNEEILKIANIKVTYNDNDITSNLEYDFSNFYNNKTNLGTFDVCYKIIINNELYEYVLKVINRDIKDDFINLSSITVKTTVNNYINEIKLKKILEEELEMSIHNLEIIDTNYYNNEEEGVFYSKLMFKSNNEYYTIDISIDVLSNNTTNYKLIGGIIIFSFLLLIIFFKKRRVKKV